MARISGSWRALVSPRSASALVGCWLTASPAAAQDAHPARPQTQKAETADRFSVSAQSETYVQLYRRALVPGQNGQVVPTELSVPVHQYVFANARDVDAPWQKDSISLEFAAWGRVWPTKSTIERPFDGDVQTAAIRLEAGPAWARFGRQQIGGGAARFARFDGVMVGARHLGFFLEAYGGFTVLPRWNDQPGYYRLGKAEDALLVYQPPAPKRGDHWLTGARLGYQTPKISGSLSFHDEQTSGGVDRRNLGLDLGAAPVSDASLGASALLDLDSLRLASARVFVDATPHPRFDLGAEFLHTEPALLLSRQSVLSVFSTDGFEEVGGTLSTKVQRWLRLDTNGYIEAYRGTGPGARGEAAARIALGKGYPTLVRVGYTRVIAPKNGYQAVRLSLGRRLTHRLSSTLEAYGYIYDEPVAGYKTSTMYAGTASYQVLDPLEIMWTASVAQSPFAALDAQTMLRATYRFDAAAKPRGY